MARTLDGATASGVTSSWSSGAADALTLGVHRPFACPTPSGSATTHVDVGTGLLVAVVVGSGIFAQRLSLGDTGLRLLESSTATAGGLVALMLAFGSVSGAHFNPDLVERGGPTARYNTTKGSVKEEQT